MINYAELELGLEQTVYEIWKDKEGVVYTVTLPEQKDLIKIGKLQFMISELENQYGKVITLKESETKYDKMNEVYNNLFKVVRQMFLFILNLNIQGKEFTLKDIDKVPFTSLQEELNNYSQFIDSSLKN